MEAQRVAVVGAGTMGQGIAQVAAQAGYETCLYDVDASRVERAVRGAVAGMDRAVEKGKLTAEARAAGAAALSGATSLEEAARGADLAIEAVPESLDLKRSVLASIEAAVPESCILASNTSSIGIRLLAEGLRRPRQFLGMHFFNPVPVMALLEIVVHAGTSDATLDEARRAGERLGKTCIVVRDSPGFASSRLGVALGLEAMRMVEQGVASPRDIDTAMELGYRHPMGPLKLTDLVGLDVRLGIAESLHEALGSEAFRPPKILVDMVREGRLGKKSGRGFYDWPEGS